MKLSRLLQLALLPLALFVAQEARSLDSVGLLAEFEGNYSRGSSIAVNSGDLATYYYYDSFRIKVTRRGAISGKLKKSIVGAAAVRNELVRLNGKLNRVKSDGAVTSSRVDIRMSSGGRISGRAYLASSADPARIEGTLREGSYVGSIRASKE